MKKRSGSPKFSPENLSDRHVMAFFAILLGIAGIMAILFVGKAAGDAETNAQNAARLMAGCCLLGAALMATWAVLRYRDEQRRKFQLNSAVDSEISTKWGQGFSQVVGIYEKPWYILCGETAVGKTAALRAAELPMALGPDGKSITDANQGLGGTFMFDWWFFDDAVVLDSAGDLIENPDQRWLGFLQRIRQARPVQPISGMLLAVSAADLMGDVEILRRKAGLLARQVQAAREQLRVRFPIYILVTKSDLITGFSDYFPLGVDLKASFQIVGWSNPLDPRVEDRNVRPEEIRFGLDGLIADLEARRSAVLARTSTSRTDAQYRIDHLDEMYAFPEAMRGLVGSLEDFCTQLLRGAADGDNATPPFLRGAYLTSALRTGDTLDVDVKRAFGLDHLPLSRRAASNRAFFIRDLFLEKVTPESGMVSPLEDVVQGVRRRTRILLGSTCAVAGVIVLGTLLGFNKTAGPMRQQAEFWNKLRDPKTALFDDDGNYNGDGVVAFFEKAPPPHNASLLLPLSQNLQKTLVDGDAQVFRNLVLLPILTRAPRAFDQGTGVLATEANDFRTLISIASQLSTPLPSLVSEAKTLLPYHPKAKANAKNIAQLLDDQVALLDSGQVTAGLSSDDAARIQASALVWLTTIVGDAQSDLNATALKTRDALGKVSLIVKDENTELNQASSGQALSNLAHFCDTHGNNDCRSAVQTASSDVQELDKKRDQYKPLIDLMSTDSSGGSALTNDMRLQLDALSKMLDSLPASAMPDDAAGAKTPDDLGTQHLSVGASNLADRNDWYRKANELQKQILEPNWLSSQFNAAPKDAANPSAFLASLYVFNMIKSRVDSVRDQIPAADQGNSSFNGTATVLLQQIGENARLAACRTALNGLQLPKVAAIPGAKAPGILWKPHVPDELNPDVLKAWLDTFSEIKKYESGVNSEDAHSQISTFARDFLSAWISEVRMAQTPQFKSWSDLGRLANGSDAGTITRDLLSTQEEARKAFTVLADQTECPECVDPANTMLAALNAPPNQDYDQKVLDFVREFGDGNAPSPLEVRQSWLQSKLNPPPNAPAGAAGQFADVFWNNLYNQSVNVLIESVTPAVRNRMGSLADQVKDQYPLYANAKGVWTHADLSALEDLETICPDGCELLKDQDACRVRDLGLLTGEWKSYIAWLRALNQFMKSHATWIVHIEKPRYSDGGPIGKWDFLTVEQNGAQVNQDANQYFRGADDQGINATIQAGGNLSNGLNFKFTKDNTDDTKVASLQDDQITQPWGLLRLDYQHGNQEFAVKIVDGLPAAPREIHILLRINSDTNPPPPNMPQEPPQPPQPNP